MKKEKTKKVYLSIYNEAYFSYKFKNFSCKNVHYLIKQTEFINNLALSADVQVRAWNIVGLIYLKFRGT